MSSALKTKYPQSGLSDNEITGLAASLFATGLVTDENVNTVVDGQADAIRKMQSLFDSRFTNQKNALAASLTESLEKSLKEKYRIGEDGKQLQTGQEDDLGAKLAKLLDERLKPLSDKMAQEEARRTQEKRTQEIIDMAKTHGIREELARMLDVPGDVTDLDSFMKDKAQTLANLGFQQTVPPGSGDGNKGDGEAIAAIIKAGTPKQETGK